MKEKDTTLTPLSLIDALGGQFDLDPCAVSGHPTAKELIVWPDDGLLQEWSGCVWCNPPYSDPSPWMRKMANHNNGLALVLASTDTKWFQEAAESADGFFWLAGRPKFLRKDGSEVGLMRANVIVSWGSARTRIMNSSLRGFYTSNSIHRVLSSSKKG